MIISIEEVLQQKNIILLLLFYTSNWLDGIVAQLPNNMSTCVSYHDFCNHYVVTAYDYRAHACPLYVAAPACALDVAAPACDHLVTNKEENQEGINSVGLPWGTVLRYVSEMW